MVSLTASRVRNATQQLETAWLYFTIFVLVTMQILLMNDLAIRKAPELGQLSWVYQLVVIWMMVLGAGRFLYIMLEWRGAD